MDATYTWSKEIDNTDNMEDNQNFNAGGGARGNNHSLTDPALNRRLGYSDVPHRLVGTFLYDLPFGKGQALEAPSAWLRAIVGGWQVGGSVIWQTGFPIAVTGAERRRGADPAGPRRRCADRAAREPVGLVRWMHTVTLPSGRVITPPVRTYLKYNPDAFAGRVVTTPNGRIVADQFWYGNAAMMYDEFRTDNRFNIDLSIRRTFGITNGVQLEFGADAMNVLNHTQFSGAYTGALEGLSPRRTRRSASCPAWATRTAMAPEGWPPSTRGRFSCGRR